MKNKRLFAILLTAALLLVIPLIAMQFTDEVKWTLFDFIAAAVLLFGAGLLCELILRNIKAPGLRIILCVVLLILLLLIWAELAVGIFGSKFSGN
jgi:peptidoglycan/LPS O-acetylase OafA/YrhL